MRFTAYSLHCDEPLPKDPPVSIVCVRDRDVLQRIAGECALFQPAWQALTGMSKDRHWLYLSESPSDDLLAEMTVSG